MTTPTNTLAVGLQHPLSRCPGAWYSSSLVHCFPILCLGRAYRLIMQSSPPARFLCTFTVLIIWLSGFAIAQQSTPTQTWTPAPTCSNGLANPAAQNGTYVDKYGASYTVQCAQDSTGFVYDMNGPTNGQGVYACFKGCDQRPGCTAFAYIGTVTSKLSQIFVPTTDSSSGPTAGSGRCYYKFTYGYYYTNSTVYAAANLISNGTPNLVCPYYNQTTYRLSDNSVWQVYCGFDSNGLAATVQSATGSLSMAQCMSQCNNATAGDCTALSYVYSGAEPLDSATAGDGTCS